MNSATVKSKLLNKYLLTLVTEYGENYWIRFQI